VRAREMQEKRDKADKDKAKKAGQQSSVDKFLGDGKKSKKNKN
jgi:hypothetical protein